MGLIGLLLAKAHMSLTRTHNTDFPRSLRIVCCLPSSLDSVEVSLDDICD